MLLVGLATALVLAASHKWPMYAYYLWGAFIAVIVTRLYFDLKKPVNYESIRVLPGGVEYVVSGQKRLVKFDEVVTLSLIREQAIFDCLDGPYIESKWFFRMVDGSGVEVVDEWPHRRLLIQSFRTQLPHFDERAARAGVRASAEGEWLCYRAPRLPPGA